MKLQWSRVGEKFFETGVKNGVLYVQDNTGAYPRGVVWNGLTAVNESPSGAEPTPLYADDGKYLTLMSAEEFGATIEAYTYPDEFMECDGSAEISDGIFVSQQTRKPFGMVYKTTIGNDISSELGYKLHIIYGALAAPSEKSYQTINDSPEAINFSWEVSTTPVPVPNKKPTASLVIDSTKVNSTVLQTIEDILFGTEEADARLPLPAEIIEIVEGGAPSALSLVSINPTHNATDVDVETNIVLTFNNKVMTESVIVMTDDGTIVAGTKTWDSTRKILTFNPTNDLSANTTYLVIIAGVTDMYGQGLVTTTKSFVTESGD